MNAADKHQAAYERWFRALHRTQLLVAAMSLATTESEHAEAAAKHWRALKFPRYCYAEMLEAAK